MRIACLALAIIALGTSVLVSSQNAMACGSQVSRTAEQQIEIKSLIEQISAKFDLKVSGLSRCGTNEVQFDFVPPTPIVPADSFFAQWNSSFGLGGIALEGPMAIEKLKQILALPVEKLEALKQARALMARDAMVLQLEHGVSFYMYPNKIVDQGGLMMVSTPKCNGGWYSSSHQLGEVQMPVATLEGLMQASNAPLYQEGDAVKAIRADAAVIAQLDQVSKLNLQDVKSREGSRRPSACAVVYNGKEDRPISWEKTRALFGIE